MLRHRLNGHNPWQGEALGAPWASADHLSSVPLIGRRRAGALYIFFFGGKEWGVYTADASGSKICFAVSAPKDTKPKNVRRSDIYVYVTTRPKEKVANELTIEIGYPFKQGSQAKAKVGNDTFLLYTNGEKAWVENAAREPALIAAMRAGSSMTVTGTSQRGTNTSDTYSLSGISAALDRVAQECK